MLGWQERDELYERFEATIYDVQQKSGFKNLLLEKKVPSSPSGRARTHTLERLSLHTFPLVILPSGSQWHEPPPPPLPRGHSTAHTCVPKSCVRALVLLRTCRLRSLTTRVIPGGRVSAGGRVCEGAGAEECARVAKGVRLEGMDDALEKIGVQVRRVGAAEE